MKYCTECKKELENDVIFCSQCGSKEFDEVVNSDANIEEVSPIMTETATRKPVSKADRIAHKIGCVLTIVFAIIIIGCIFKSCFTPKPIEERMKAAGLSFYGGEPALEYKNGLPYITGFIKNESDKNYSMVHLYFDLYDKDGYEIGTAYTNVEKLVLGKTLYFEAVAEEETETFKLTSIPVNER